MSNWLAVVLLAALPLSGAEHEAPVATALYVHFEQQPPMDVWNALRAEVETIMAPMGTEFDWRSLDAVTGTEVSTQLAVVKFFGRCDVSGPAMHNFKTSALGWTHISDGAILPFTDIDCDGIRDFLQFGLQSIDPKMRLTVYGRAVGRVLAHELYHIFAHTTHHGSNGVGKAIYSEHDLLSPDFRFQDRESEALRINRPHPEVIDVTR
jgi:hypothetical protein